MKYTFYIAYLLLSISCQHRETRTTFLGLIPTSKLEISLNEQIKPRSNAMFSYRKEGVEYLAYLNDFKQNILFFNLDSKKKEFEINLQIEGPDGVGVPKGFYVKTLDSVFITSKGRKEIFLVNRNGKIIDKYNYSKAVNGSYIESTFYARSMGNSPLVIRNNEMYLTNKPGGYYPSLPSDYLKTVPLALTLNMNNKKVDQIGVGGYPEGLWTSEARYAIWFSRVFDGDNFVYVWWHSDSLYVTRDHVIFKGFKLKSEYFNRFASRPKRYDDVLELERYNCENPKYDHVVYDKYRELFYVFAYIGVETDAQTDIMKLTNNKSAYSILIYNKEFKKLGEYKLEENRFLPDNYFVGSKGLYISENNEFNPNFDENKLKFTLFQPKFKH